MSTGQASVLISTALVHHKEKQVLDGKQLNSIDVYKDWTEIISP